MGNFEKIDRVAVSDILFRRAWEMPNSNTFEIKSINRLIHKYFRKEYNSIDPFANKSRLAPPYSLRQVSECYKNVGVEVTQETTQSSWRSKHLDEISRIVKPNGLVISFGWNSSGVGKTRGFELLEILLVAHGGSHNDTIVTVERKIPDLFD